MIEYVDFEKAAEIIEVTLTCLKCGARFFGTLYRVKADENPDE